MSAVPAQQYVHSDGVAAQWGADWILQAFRDAELVAAPGTQQAKVKARGSALLAAIAANDMNLAAYVLLLGGALQLAEEEDAANADDGIVPERP